MTMSHTSQSSSLFQWPGLAPVEYEYRSMQMSSCIKHIKFTWVRTGSNFAPCQLACPQLPELSSWRSSGKMQQRM